MTILRTSLGTMEKNKINYMKAMHWRRWKTIFLKVITIILFVIFVMQLCNLHGNFKKNYSSDVKSKKFSLSHFRDRIPPIFFSDANCPIPSLKNSVLQTGTGELFHEKVSCKRLKAVKGSCQIAKDLFMKKRVETCDHQQRYDICQIKGSLRNRTVTCDMSMCNGPVKVLTLSSKSGNFKSIKFTTASDLESFIILLADGDSNLSNFGFCVIECPLREYANGGSALPPQYFRPDISYSNYYNDDNSARQIILLPLKFTSVKSNNNNRMININLLFVDSVSRHHFYRSMPETLSLLEKINSEYLKGGNISRSPMVLDFKLFQGIKSRTFESLQALFDGFVNPNIKPFSSFSNPPEALKIQTLLKQFKHSGYRTLWLEDLCWIWEWGISKYLSVVNKSLGSVEVWKNLQNALRTAMIDAMDLSYASCKIMKENGVRDPFHGPDVVCFNGRHQHEYNLEYLQNYQMALTEKNLPYLSFYETNIAHEDTGLRIQMLDKNFAEYLGFAAKQKNTLTIIFSDHGNTYGNFIDQSSEGRVEIFQPFLFMIIPENVKKHFGLIKMNNLVVNQGRLTSILDLHYMLRAIQPEQGKPSLHPESRRHVLKKYDIPIQGLFSNISANRTCNDIPLLMPNLCICEGFDYPAQNGTQFALIADFIVGSLNNEILRQLKAQNILSSERKCRQLKTKGFQNVKISNDNDYSLIKMEVIIKSVSADQDVIFFAVVKLETKPSYKMELMMYEQITAYSKYSSCSDKGVELQLCVCSLDQQNTPSVVYNISQPSPFLTVELRKVGPNGIYQKCIVMIVQKNKYGCSYRVTNTCDREFFNVNFIMQTKNLFVYKIIPDTVNVGPREIILVGSAMSYAFFTHKRVWECSYKISVLHSSR